MSQGVQPRGRSGVPGRPSTGRATAGRSAGRPVPTPSSGAGAKQRARASAPAHRKVRGRRVPLIVGAVIALIVVGTSFPAAALLSQHKQLASADARLAALRHENDLLAQQQHDLKSNVAIGRLAREEYQLVPAGESLYQVLPATGSSSRAVTGLGGQGVVDPADAPDLSPDPGLAPPSTVGATSGSGAAGSTHGTTGGSPAQVGGATAPAGSFWSRVGGSLEFWR